MMRLGLIAALLVPATLAWGVTCDVTFGDVDYGQLAATPDSVSDSQGTLTYSCSWGPLEAAAVDRMRMCVHIGPGTVRYNAAPGGYRKLTHGSSRMRHDLFSDAARTSVWGTRFDNVRNAKPVEILIDAQGIGPQGGSSGGSRAVFGRAYGDSELPSGTYADTFSGANALITYGPADDLRNCNTASGERAYGSFRSRALLGAQCSIGASPLEFGAVSATDSPIQATSTITVRCTMGADWQVALSAGHGPGATTDSRRMVRRGGDEVVRYQLYRDAQHTQAWGDAGNVNTASGEGNGDEQQLRVFGRVPMQSTPPVGVYQDTVVATVTF